MERQSDDEVRDMVTRADGILLDVLGPDAYMRTCALMEELEQVVDPLDATKAAQALATFNTLVALRYAQRRRHA